MSCKRYAGDLADAVAGGPVTTGLQVHLRECEACRTRLLEGRRVLADVDRDLADALAVEPSADLLARVKDRIAQGESVAGESSLGVPMAWRIAAAVAVAAGVVGSLWLLRSAAPEGKLPRTANASPSMPVAPSRPPDGAGTAPTGPVASQAPASAFPSGATPSQPNQPNTAKRLAPTGPARRVPTPPSEPEVLMPAGEAALLGRFVAILRTRTVEPSSLLMARSEENLPEPKPIDVSPLEIRPLSEEVEPADDGRME